MPAIASTPGMVISRATTGSVERLDGQLLVDHRQLGAVEVQLPQQGVHAGSARRPAAAGVDSQCRPVLPNRSDTGGVGARLRAKIAWTWFLILVRCRTRCARRVTCRRNARVRSSGSHTGGRKSAASSCARIRASTLSVLTFASAIARVLRRVRHHHPAHERASAGSRSRRCCRWPPTPPDHRRADRPPTARNASGVDPDPALVADQAVLDHRELRELAMHIHPDIAHHPLLPSRRSNDGEPLGRNDTYGYALAAQPDQSQGRPTTNTGSQPTEQERPAHTCSPKAPVPDGHTVCPARDAEPAEQHADPRRLSYRVPTRSSR